MQGKIGQVKKRREGGGLQVRVAQFKCKKRLACDFFKVLFVFRTSLKRNSRGYRNGHQSRSSQVRSVLIENVYFVFSIIVDRVALS
jgi:hypothetical protein